MNDGILAVFIVESSKIREMYIEKNYRIDKSLVESIFNLLNNCSKSMDVKKADNANEVALENHL